MFFNLHTLLLRMWPTDEGKKQDIHEAHQWFWVSFSTRSLRLSSQETTTVNMTWTDTRIATMLDCSEVMCQNVNPKYLISADQACAGRWPLVTDQSFIKLQFAFLTWLYCLDIYYFELWTTLRHWELTSSRSLVVGIFGIAWIFLMFDVTNLFLPAC